MRYRRFGKTGMNLSVFSMGGMRFIPPHVDEGLMEAILWRGIELGINHIETARGYKESEERIGSLMDSLPREDLFITTKISPQDDEETMWRFINESVDRLRCGWIDNFDYHGVNTFEILGKVTDLRGCRRAVERAVGEGLIRHVGFSTHGPLEVILAAIDSGMFSSVNLHYYYFNQRNRRAVERAAELDMGVFIISPADKGGQLFYPSGRLRELCGGVDPLVFNARWLLGLHPEVHTLSFGPSSLEEFEPHLPAFDDDGPLSVEELEILGRMDGQWEEIPVDEFCGQCWRCLPCPEGINIPEVLRLRNLAVGFGMVDFGRYRYKMFEVADHWYPGRKGDKCADCHDCLPRCPMGLDIPRLLRDTHGRLDSGEAGRRVSDA